MATNIFNYDGTLLTTVQDGTIDSSSSTIKIPGRGYQNYGEAINENILWIEQNFANATPPANPITGQLWYDTIHSLVKFYSGTVWIVVNGLFLSGTQPVAGNNTGALWYDTTNKQLHIWNGIKWDIVGPLGSAINTDPQNPTIPTFSSLDAARISDNVSAYHQIWRLTVGGTLLAIISKDASFTPLPAITGFTTVHPGFNINSSITDVGYFGDATLFRNTQTNLPSVDTTWNLGSSAFKFANVYATNFNGVATSALYADVAERYESDEPLDPGTVVMLGGRKEVAICRNYGDDEVFGVVSTAPAFKMNSEAGNDDTHPYIALLGRVPCKVMGPVYKGQRIMGSDTPGVAEAWDSDTGVLSILGRALVTLATSEIELIEVVLGKK